MTVNGLNPNDHVVRSSSTAVFLPVTYWSYPVYDGSMDIFNAVSNASNASTGIDYGLDFLSWLC